MLRDARRWAESGIFDRVFMGEDTKVRLRQAFDTCTALGIDPLNPVVEVAAEKAPSMFDPTGWKFFG